MCSMLGSREWVGLGWADTTAPVRGSPGCPSPHVLALTRNCRPGVPDSHAWGCFAQAAAPITASVRVGPVRSADSRRAFGRNAGGGWVSRWPPLLPALGPQCPRCRQDGKMHEASSPIGAPPRTRCRLCRGHGGHQLLSAGRPGCQCVPTTVVLSQVSGGTGCHLDKQGLLFHAPGLTSRIS